MNDAAKFFVSESAALARSLPVKDGIRFLRGLLQTVGNVPEAAGLREALVLLSQSDSKLADLASGEWKMKSASDASHSPTVVKITARPVLPMTTRPHLRIARK